MPKQKIDRKRITPKVLEKLYPQVVADKVIEIANEYGNEGEMGIKSFIPQTVDTNHSWHTREGDKYIVMDASGKEVSVEMVSQDAIGATNVSHKLDTKFQLPAETFMIMITYYKKYIMKVYTCEVAEKLGPVVSELTAKMEKLELPADVNKTAIAEAASSAKEMLDTVIEEKSDLEKWDKIIRPDAVLSLPKLDSETGEVTQAEIKPKVEQLPDNLVNTGIEDAGPDTDTNTYDPIERDPKVLQPRKRRTKPLEVEPISAKPVSSLKARSPDGDNLYHGEVVIVGIGENEGKEILATMKIGGRKWICLSGGWESNVEVGGKKLETGNMKEVMGVFHTQFHRSTGDWKGNKAGNGWIIRDEWLKTIIETK